MTDIFEEFVNSIDGENVNDFKENAMIRFPDWTYPDGKQPPTEEETHRMLRRRQRDRARRSEIDQRTADIEWATRQRPNMNPSQPIEEGSVWPLVIFVGFVFLLFVLVLVVAS